MTAAIKAERVSKRYTLGTGRGYRTLRDTLSGAAHSIFDRRERPGPAEGADVVWALRDVSFEVGQGEVLGVIGRNGAGKSTLLRILSRITAPNQGRMEMYGRVAALLEIGTGFHPELTGRENVFLNGAILGMSRVDIRRKFDQIVDFAGVQRFIDTPVKRYSSGMYVRLAFAVAAHVDTDILIVDEVLAVGDVAFQKQCLGRMREVSSDGRTVLFVSHNLSAIANLCTSALWLHEGQVRQRGSVSAVLSGYAAEVRSAPGVAATARQSMRVVSVEVLGQDAQPSFDPFSPCSVRTVFETRVRLDPAEVNVVIQDAEGRTCIHLRTDFDACYPVFEPGRHVIETHIDALNLESQIYFLWVRIVSRNPREIADSESVPLEVRAGWDRHENMRPIVAVKRNWSWRPHR